jgi:HK97 family phage prohead protease
MERKAINFELKDIDKSKRTALIAHCVFNNIDLTKDISEKGMFTKSWKESKDDISFYLNHNDEQAPGKVIDVFEDGNAAYTKTWCGTHTLGNDVLTMMDEGIIKKASFGYIAEKKEFVTIKGESIRKLKEVRHIETSVLTKMPANPLAGVRQVIKSFMPELKTLTVDEQTMLKRILSSDQNILEQLVGISAGLEVTSDLYTWINWNIERRSSMMGDIRSQLKYNSGDIKNMKSHMEVMEKFCRDTKASDDCIKSILIEIENTKQLITEYDTVFTQAIEPSTSENDKQLLDALTTFNKQLKNVGKDGNQRTDSKRA